MRPSRPLISLRDWRIGLPTSDVSTCRKPLDLADQFGAEAADDLDATGQWLVGPARLRGAGARVGRRDRLGGVVGQFGNDAAVRGIDERSACGSRLAAGGARGVEEVAEQRVAGQDRRVLPVVELRMPLHGRQVGLHGPTCAVVTDRFDDAVVRAARLDDEVGRKVLDALMVHAVDDVMRQRTVRRL